MRDRSALQPTAAWAACSKWTAPIAPGTAGTVVGVLLYLLIKALGMTGYGAACISVIAIGTWAAGHVDRMFGTKDDSTIVIDDIAGFLIALYFIPFTWGNVAAGFFLFRAFDIIKPWPLRRFERIPGGPGYPAGRLDDRARQDAKSGNNNA